MKIVRILISVLAAIVVAVASVGAQTAPPPPSTTTGTVKVIENGSFKVYVCPWNNTHFRYNYWGGANRRDPIVTSSQGENTHGSLTICYLDSQGYRDAFHITVQATDFVSITPGVSATIDVENLTMYRTYSIGRWGFETGIHQPGPYEGMWYSTSPLGEYPARAWDATDPNLPWNPGATLDTPRTIARAEEGSGLSQGLEGLSGEHVYTLRQPIFMGLYVPTGTPAATYQTTLTITVMPGSP